MTKKILIAAGGTGGHIYPALATAKKLIAKDSSIEIMFVGGGLEANPFFNQTSFNWKAICSAPLPKNLHIFRNAVILTKGVLQSLKLLASFKPDLVVGFGSYHSFPVLAAAKVLRYPIALHEQNSMPGKVNRYFSKSAKTTGIFFPSAAHALRGKTSLLSMPLRDGFSLSACRKESAYHYYEFDSCRKTLLIFGGSQGANVLNKYIPQLIVDLKNLCSSFQVLHFAGDDSEVERLAELYKANKVSAIVKKLENRMDYAWRIADLAIVRAGAGTIAEQLAFEVPAIFIPYPHAADDHQNHNADFVVDTIGGGWKLKELELTSNIQKAKNLLGSLLESPTLLTEKLQNLSKYNTNTHRQEFVDLLL